MIPTLTRTAGWTALALALGLAAPHALAQTDGDEAPAAADGGEAAEAQDAGGDAQAEEVPAVPMSAETVLATVNGKDITLGELIALRRELPAETQAIPPRVLLQGLLDQVVTFELMAQAATEAGLPERKDYALVLNNTRRIGLANVHMRFQVSERVSEEAVEAAYAEKYTANPVEEVRASHILVDSEEKAKDLKKQLDEGADFAELAKEHGTDGTRERGGDLGYFVKADMVPEFGNAVFALEAGTISEPVQSPFGWHLIEVVDKRERAAPPLEQVRAQIVTELSEAAQEQILADVREGAEIELKTEGVEADAIMNDTLIIPVE